MVKNNGVLYNCFKMNKGVNVVVDEFKWLYQSYCNVKFNSCICSLNSTMYFFKKAGFVQPMVSFNENFCEEHGHLESI